MLTILKTNEKTLLFYIQYNLYCNELELYKYISKTIDNHIIDSIRKQKALKNKNKIIVIQPKITPIEKIYNEFKDQKIKELMDFIELFFENNKILSETEVAKKLNITRQAVNKRKNKLLKKYKQDI